MHFHDVVVFLRHLLPDRPAHLTYVPPLTVAAIDHSTGWLTYLGLAIGIGGLINHSIQTWIRFQDHQADNRRAEAYERRPR
jgi:hypothetical protein